MKPLTTLVATAALAATVFASSAAHAAEVTLTGYSVAKPVYAKIIPAFKKAYKAQSGDTVTFKESYQGSGAQTRAVLGGLEADVMMTNVQQYIDPLVDAGMVNKDWATRLPNNSVPATSVVVAIVRDGNPKNIKDWTDFTRPGIEIVALNPKTSGNARWSLLGGYAALDKPDDHSSAEAYIKGIVKNTKTLVNGGREATDAFARNHIGDLVLTFENEAKFAAKAGTKTDYVAPTNNIQVDFPVTVIDKNVDKHGSRAAAEAFVKFLFSPEAQEIYADAGYRPSDKAILAKHEGDYAKVDKIVTIDQLGGWAKFNKMLFDDGALYDQAQASK